MGDQLPKCGNIPMETNNSVRLSSQDRLAIQYTSNKPTVAISIQMSLQNGSSQGLGNKIDTKQVLKPLGCLIFLSF